MSKIKLMSNNNNKNPIDVAQLVASGYGVSELRSAGVSPAEIKAAGFSIQEMHAQLGIHKLREAGFELKDFQRANFPVEEIVDVYPLEEILRTSPGRYLLADLMHCCPPAQLRTVGNFTAKDFLLLGNISATDLRQFGFTQEEISAAMHTTTPLNVIVPGPEQPPHAANMAVGESWSHERTGTSSPCLRVTYTRLSPAEAGRLLAHPHAENHQVQSTYPYDGSGKLCPRCGRRFVLLEKWTSSDGMCGVENGKWICDDADCGMMKTEDYEGHGSIF
jgi:hypothetical protein